MNIVSDVEGEGVELIPEDRALYDKMVANPDDKNIQTETVDRVREVLEELLAIAIARGDAQEQGGRRRRNRRRTTKKRKALKKRTTRRR